MLVPTHEGDGDEYGSDSAASIEYYCLDYSDGQGGVRFKSKFLAFNPKSDKGCSEPVKGMKFANPHQLKDCLTSYAVARGYPIKFDRNSRHNLLAICAKGCPFRLWASWMQNEILDFARKLLELIRFSFFPIGITLGHLHSLHSCFGLGILFSLALWG
ncbi:hypothetical protein LguiA_022046 [Lonicera macranthoides]